MQTMLNTNPNKTSHIQVICCIIHAHVDVNCYSVVTHRPYNLITAKVRCFPCLTAPNAEMIWSKQSHQRTTIPHSYR